MAITIDQPTLGLGGANGANPFTFDTTSAAAAATRIIIFLDTFGTPTGVTTTGGGGLTFSQDKSQANTAIGSIWSVYAPSGLASGSTISIAFGSTPGICLGWGMSFNGVASSSALDQTNSRTASNEQAWTSSSITPSEANTVVVGYFASNGGPDSRSTPDSGWTESFDQGGFSNNLVAVYQIVSDTAARNPSGNFANAQTADQIGITVNYKQAPAANAIAWVVA